MPLAGGTHQSANGPAGSQMSADQTQAPTVLAPTVTARSGTARVAGVPTRSGCTNPAPRRVFSLANQPCRGSARQGAQHSSQESEPPNKGPTLTTDLEDYPPFSYVYFYGTGFEPGETVDMIVVELSPNPASFEP